MKWQAPELLWATVGHAEGETPLTAFDSALIEAGIGQWNLVKVTSVAPPAAVLVSQPIVIEPGAVVPAVLCSVHSNRPGETISACVGIGFNSEGHGMIMEHSGQGSPEEMEASVRRMIDESLGRRGLKPESVSVHSVSHTVEKVGSCVAAVVLWWR